MSDGVAILGSTGSIGTQTLQVIDSLKPRFNVKALAGGRQIDLLAQQIRTHQPRLVSTGDYESAKQLKPLIPGDVEVVWGEEGLVEIASMDDAPIVVSAVVGAVGVMPTFAALEAGKRVAFANKESLVAAGELMMSAAEKGGGILLPVDSEHSALFQALNGENTDTINTLILTASGGAFRTWSREAMENAGPSDALKHPTWDMGGKITIDCATLFNKGLEVIEAHHLFRIPYDQIEVVIHPESIVHSLVEFIDGSMIAQLGTADMRLPIQYALTYPDRIQSAWPKLSLFDANMTFERPDVKRFPALALAYAAGRAGGTAPAVLNAANEVAVEAFLAERISFPDIVRCVEHVLTEHNIQQADSLETILLADDWARNVAARHVARTEFSN